MFTYIYVFICVNCTLKDHLIIKTKYWDKEDSHRIDFIENITFSSLPRCPALKMYH